MSTGLWSPADLLHPIDKISGQWVKVECLYSEDSIGIGLQLI